LLPIKIYNNNFKYYWRVRAENYGVKSFFSDIWSFVTIIGPPILVSPMMLSTGVSTNPTFRWKSASGAASYRFQVSDKYDFSNIIMYQSDIIDTSYFISGLEYNKNYIWHVKVKTDSNCILIFRQKKLFKRHFIIRQSYL